MAINDRGQVLGSTIAGLYNTHAYLWDKGVPADLGALGGDFSYASALSDSGLAAGYSDTAAHALHAFLWEHGRLLDLGAWAATAASPSA